MSRTLGLAFAALGVLSTRAAVADEAYPAVLMLVGEPDSEDTRATVMAVSSQLSDVEAELVIRSVDTLPADFDGALRLFGSLTSSRDVAAVFWIAREASGAAVLFLFEGNGSRALLRRVETEAEGETARGEALAVIVRMSLEALLRGGRIGVSVDEMDAAPPVPVATRAAVVVPPPSEKEGAKRRWFRVGAAYLLLVRSTDHPAVSGGDLSVAMSPVPNLAVGVAYTFLQRIEAADDRAALSLARHPLRIGLRGSLRRSAIELGLSLDLVMDWSTFEVKVGPRLTGAVDLRDFFVGLLPAFDLGVVVVSRIILFASLGVEVDLPALSYGYRLDGQRVVLANAWEAQPRLLIGVAVDLP
jgi:hypothetical protein